MTEQERNCDIPTNLQLFVIKEAEKTKKSILNVLSLIVLVLGIAAGFGIKFHVDNMIDIALKDPALEELKKQVNLELIKARKAQEKIESAKHKIEKIVENTELGNPDFESDWMKVKYKNTYQILHDLGSVPRKYTVFFSEDPTKQTFHLANQIWAYHSNERGRGIMITDISTSKLLLQTGGEWLFDSYAAGNGENRIYTREGFIKVLCWR